MGHPSPNTGPIPGEVRELVAVDLHAAGNAIAAALRWSNLFELARYVDDADVTHDPLAGNSFAETSFTLEQASIAEHLQRACRLMTWALHYARKGESNAAKGRLSDVRAAVTEHVRVNLTLVWVRADSKVSIGHFDELAVYLRAVRAFGVPRVTEVYSVFDGHLRDLPWFTKRYDDDTMTVSVEVDRYTTLTGAIFP